MGELENRLESFTLGRLDDAAPLGRSKSAVSATDATEYAGATYAAFNAIEARINALDSLGVGYLAANLESRLINKLVDAGALGRSKTKISRTEMKRFIGIIYTGYEALAVRVGNLEGGAPGTEMEGRLETSDKNKITDAAALGRSKNNMPKQTFVEWSGATYAAYHALDARVIALEGAS